MSARGCWTNSKYIPDQSGEKTKFIKKDSDGNTEEKYESFARKGSSQSLIEERAGFLENLMHNIYQVLLLCKHILLSCMHMDVLLPLNCYNH